MTVAFIVVLVVVLVAVLPGGLWLAARRSWRREAPVVPPPRRRGLDWLLLAGLVGLAVVAAVRGRWSGVPTAWLAEMLAAQMWLERGPRRASPAGGQRE